MLRHGCAGDVERHLRHPRAPAWSALLLLLALAGCGQGSGLLNAGATPSPTWTQKQAVLATVAAQGTAAASGYHAPKYPGALDTPPSSCPLPTPQPGIFAPNLPTRGYPDAVVDNATATIPADQPQNEYIILAGSRKSNPQQGLLIVQRLVTDPCAFPTAPSGDMAQTYYDTPFQQGHVQLTAVAGDSIIFTTARGGGSIYTFDFERGKFL